MYQIKFLNICTVAHMTRMARITRIARPLARMARKFIKLVTHHADDDANLLIVKTAVQSARTKTTVLIGDDTDLLILLLFHTNTNTHDLYLIPDPKSNSLTRRAWNIKQIQAELGTEICENILFIHAVLKCDTTSRVHAGIEKIGQSLDTLRYQSFQEKLTRNTAKIDAKSLLPTSAATKFHSLRVKSFSGEGKRLMWKIGDRR